MQPSGQGEIPDRRYSGAHAQPGSPLPVSPVRFASGEPQDGFLRRWILVKCQSRQ
jgi:hypothetical protein